MNINTSNSTASEEMSVKEIILKLQDWWRYLISKWIVILVTGLIGGAIGLFYSMAKKPNYIATLTFVLEEEGKGGGLGNLGGLAAMAGINIGGAGGGGIFQGDNILELYKSRSMLTKTMLSYKGGNDSLLIDRYIAFNDLRDGWKDAKLKNIDFSIPIDDFTLQHDSLIGLFVNDIKKNNLTISKPDKMLSLIKVETLSENESFSKDFTEVLVQNVNAFYVDTKTKKALENLAIVQHQADSVRQELNAAIGGVASAIDANPNANLARQSLNVSSSKRQVDVQANQAILTELVKNLELSKISLRRETPLIQIIDQPVLPLKKEKVGKVIGIVLGGIVAGFLIVLILIIKKVYKETMHSEE